MTNNDIFKKLRVALMLRDDQIVEILELVDFRITKSELGAFFRDEKHPNYMECGDQVLRNFLNALVIHLRGTKENPKNPTDVLAKHKAQIPAKEGGKERAEFKATPKDTEGARGDQKPGAKADFKKKPSFKSKDKKAAPKVQVVEKVKYSNGNKKKS
ncbi:hypothetical protein FFWV33_09195 [Flavobacterium faecale]|uniref:Uncharacterized protein n=1 Tax=Flavobacterium faecale TaxID=1355330 RepID=A0A2S1LDC8_9FLAO|nr:DUF1456 family protein [Flavobacterium faecale]AWG21701.1 hypothetical protein FFWV33_09195 [Flavobacterium faecale]